MGTRVMLAIVALLMVAVMVVAGYAAGYPLLPDQQAPQPIVSQVGASAHIYSIAGLEP
jgi:hypothetical protein